MSNLLDKLPRIVEVSDYHEFNTYQEILRSIFDDKSFKVKEVGFYDGFYVGVAYYGKQTPAVKELIEFVQSESKKYDEEY